MMSSPDIHPVGGHVLVVEDETFNRVLIRKMVAALGCGITECERGAGVVGVARDCQPDVALIDVQLPDIDGFAVCRQLMADSFTADIPVIMVTSRSDIADIEEGFNAGAIDYVRKPYNPRELLARIRNAIELKRRGDVLRRWKERMSRELALAGALQRALLATRPYLHEKILVHCAYQPSSEVGGDFFDVMPLADGRLAIYIGDVAGHGVGPAIVATMLKASLAELLNVYASSGPARVCNELNARFLRQIDMPTMFATLFLGLVDVRTGRWHCLSCGHPAPIVAGIEGLNRSDIDKRGGPPIGVAIGPAARYAAGDEIEFVAPEGSRLLFVTDGLIEAMHTGGEEAGGRRLLADLLETWPGDGGESAAEFIFGRMREQGYELQRDDCAALSVEHVLSGEILLRESLPASLQTVNLLARRVEETLTGAGWPERVVWAVALLLHEHGANVIQHGRPPPDSSLGIQLRVREMTCQLLVRDAGVPWDMSAPVPEPSTDAERGRGLFITRRIATNIESCRDGDTNVTVFNVRRDWSPET